MLASLSRPRAVPALRTIALAFTALIAAIAPSSALAQDVARGSSGLPVPRFVSLKSDPVNARIGPSRDHAIAYVYRRAGLPVEVFAEFDNWRRVRDADGDESWVYHSLLSGRRTAVVAPWAAGGQEPAADDQNETSSDTPAPAEARPLRARANPDARITAYLAPNVLTNVEECDGKWCRLSGDVPQDYEGWMAQDELFGVYPGEVIE